MAKPFVSVVIATKDRISSLKHCLTLDYDTVTGVVVYHQWHKPASIDTSGYIFEYDNELQARLLEPCRGGERPIK